MHAKLCPVEPRTPRRPPPTADGKKDPAPSIDPAPAKDKNGEPKDKGKKE